MLTQEDEVMCQLQSKSDGEAFHMQQAPRFAGKIPVCWTKSNSQTSRRPTGFKSKPQLATEHTSKSREQHTT